MKKLLFGKKARVVPVVERKTPTLLFCIVMDLLGCASFTIPLFGEVFDLAWAPISAMIYMRTFGGVKGFLGGGFNFIEELLPGTDFIPTFTLTWLLQQGKRRRAEANIIQLR